MKKKLKQKKKIIFVKFAPKRSVPKWTSNKMGNAKKGHNKTGRAKVVVPKRRASVVIPREKNTLEVTGQ